MNDRMQQTLLGLQEAYARQAARLAEIRAGIPPHLRGRIIQAHADTNGVPPARKPTADDVRGMAWFNGLSEQRRAYWLQCAGSSRPVDAWRHFNLCREVEVCLR
jgi:hypothetical protein